MAGNPPPPSSPCSALFVSMCARQFVSSQFDVIKEQGDAQMAKKVITRLICIVMFSKTEPLRRVCRTTRDRELPSKKSRGPPFYLCADIIPNYLPSFQTGDEDCQERKCKVTQTSRPTHVLHYWSQRLLARSESFPSQRFLALPALRPAHTDSHIRVHLHNPARDWSQFNEGW